MLITLPVARPGEGRGRSRSPRASAQGFPADRPPQAGFPRLAALTGGTPWPRRIFAGATTPPLPLPPETLWPTGHVRRVAPFEHDAFDRFSVGTGAGGLRIGARARKLGPRGERYEGREINA